MKQLRCPGCKTEFKSRNSLNKHIHQPPSRTKRGKKACAYFAMLEAGKDKDVIKKQYDDDTTLQCRGTKHSCPRNGKAFPSVTHRRQHERVSCKKPFLMGYLKMTEEEADEYMKSNLFLCNYCDTSCTTEGDLKTHQHYNCERYQIEVLKLDTPAKRNEHRATHVKTWTLRNWKNFGIQPPKGLTLERVYDIIHLPATHCWNCDITFDDRTYKKNAHHDHRGKIMTPKDQHCPGPYRGSFMPIL